MVDYERLYSILFNGITDAIVSLEKQNYGQTKDYLIRIQQKAEDIYIQMGE